MPQVSKFPVNKDVYDEIFGVFLETIVSLDTNNKVAAFFEEFLTPTERIMLAKRLAIGLLISKSYNYEEISHLLRVSTSTICDYATLYKHKAGYRQVVNQIMQKKQIEEFLLDLGEKIASVVAMGGSKGKVWSGLRNELRKKKIKRTL